MRRTDRLFEIIQLFRGGQLLLGRDIAERLEVSLRTIYRDIDTLVASGVPIEGERGVGYIMREPVFLPPLTLNNVELEALHLGVKIVQSSKDAQLADAARNLLIKIDAVLQGSHHRDKPLAGLRVFSFEGSAPLEHLGIIRRAIREQQILNISYVRLNGVKSKQRIWPLQVEYWGNAWTCTAWCELRAGFRVFRIDRIGACAITGDVFKQTGGKTYQDYLQYVKDTG